MSKQRKGKTTEITFDEITTTTTTTYSYTGKYYKGFLVDIVEKSDIWEAWLYHTDYGVKEMMFGVAKNDPDDTTEGFIKLVFANLVKNPYIENYIDLYMDED